LKTPPGVSIWIFSLRDAGDSGFYHGEREKKEVTEHSSQFIRISLFSLFTPSLRG